MIPTTMAKKTFLVNKQLNMKVNNLVLLKLLDLEVMADWSIVWIPCHLITYYNFRSLIINFLLRSAMQKKTKVLNECSWAAHDEILEFTSYDSVSIFNNQHAFLKHRKTFRINFFNVDFF